MSKLKELPEETIEKIKEIAGKYQGWLSKLQAEGSLDEETFFYFWIATKEFFNLNHGIITPEMIFKLEPKEDLKILTPTTIEVITVEGNSLIISSQLPPQGVWNGETWFGISQLKEKVLGV